LVFSLLSLGRFRAAAAVLDLLLAVAGLVLHGLRLDVALDLRFLAFGDRLARRGASGLLHIVRAVRQDVLERQLKVVAHALDGREVLGPGRLLRARVGQCRQMDGLDVLLVVQELLADDADLLRQVLVGVVVAGVGLLRQLDELVDDGLKRLEVGHLVLVEVHAADVERGPAVHQADVQVARLLVAADLALGTDEDQRVAVAVPRKVRVRLAHFLLRHLVGVELVLHHELVATPADKVVAAVELLGQHLVVRRRAEDVGQQVVHLGLVGLALEGGARCASLKDLHALLLLGQLRAVVVVLLLLSRANGKRRKAGLLGHGVLGRKQVLAGLLQLQLELGLAVGQALGNHVAKVDVGRLGLGLGKANAADGQDRGDHVGRGLGQNGGLLEARRNNEGQNLRGHCYWEGKERIELTCACELVFDLWVVPECVGIGGFNFCREVST
jgi:hypothetical protein